jgi:hypothetical protein
MEYAVKMNELKELEVLELHTGDKIKLTKLSGLS